MSMHDRPRFVVSSTRDATFASSPVDGAVVAFHRSLAGYAATPLVAMPEVAAELGVRAVLVKDESSRLGLPAFKALGASWAMRRAIDELGVVGRDTLTFVTATDGNHGRAVARTARLLAHRALVLAPDGIHPAAIGAIESEGATVVRVPGSYDDAVAEAARMTADDGSILLQDTAWPGYERVPSWIVEGYSTLFVELDEQLGGVSADLVVVPAGVGSLAQAAIVHYRRAPVRSATALVTAEPVAAPCVFESVRAGAPVTVPTSDTIMAGLNAGTVSSLAWPLIRHGLDAAAVVTDDEARDAGDAMRRAGIDAGPCGWAALAAARLALTGAGADERRAALGVGADSVVVLLATEGAGANPAR